MLLAKKKLTYLLVAWHCYHPPRKCKNLKMLVTLPKYLNLLFNIKMHIYLSLDSISNIHDWCVSVVNLMVLYLIPKKKIHCWIKNREFIYAFTSSVASLTIYTCINWNQKFNHAFTRRIYTFWWIILQISFLVCLDETI